MDDTFAVVKVSDVDKILSAINSRYPSIKFTHEMEHEIDHTLEFLDLKIKRTGRRIEFDIHSKTTTTDRYITNDSFCSHQHKTAAFNSMVYRLVRLPLSAHSYMVEYNRIINIANTNGFKKSLIDRLVYKQMKRVRRDERSTLFTQNKTCTQSNTRHIAINYVPEISNRLHKSFNRVGFAIAHTNTNKLRTSFGSTKDKKPTERKCGIYEITCPICQRKYIGQTKRAVLCRIKEHKQYINKKSMHTSIAAHVYDSNNDEPHLFDPIENYKLIKNVNQPCKLDAYESLYISINDKLLNIDECPIQSNLFALAK